MPEKATKTEGSERVGVLKTITNALRFFALVLLVSEAVLGGLALKTQGSNQIAIIYCMVALFLALIGAVTLLTILRPEALLGREQSQAVASEVVALDSFCDSICGYWWQQINPGEPSVISYAVIRPNPATRSVKINGESFDKDCETEAVWESEASCLIPADRKVLYSWKGHHPDRPEQPYEGFGHISFQGDPSRMTGGSGLYFDINLSDVQSTKRKSRTYERFSDDEAKVFSAGNRKAIEDLIRSRLAGR